MTTSEQPTTEPTTIELPELCLVVLVGVTGAGKSTFAHKHFAPTEVLSSDTFRGLVADDPTDQSATADAFDALFDVAGRRLRRGLLTVVDATSVRPEDRRSLLALAKEHDVFAVAVVLDVELDVLIVRASDRTDVDGAVVRRQHRLLQQQGKNLRKEGFRFVHQLTGQAAVDDVCVVRTRLFNDLTADHGPFDVIGDVHGCQAELVALLEKLDWTLVRETNSDVTGAHDHPDGRRVIFVGDLVDRGPDTPGVLCLAMAMVAAGQAICVRGNHEEKLLRVLRKRDGRGRENGSVPLTPAVAASVAQLDECSDEFRSAVIEFLDGLVSHFVLDDGRLVVCHAGLAQRYHGRTSGRVRNLAMYGETTGDTDRWGYPIRSDWARDYRGDAQVVYGHTPIPVATWINNTLCLDTGCVFGGRLTALRYPESEIVDVPAGAAYWPSERPMGYSDSAEDARVRAELRLDDVLGKRTITTRFGPSVVVREENAAAALEVMSRYATDPRWLRYLPPTMSPAGSSDPDLLEDPQSAFTAYAEAGVSQVLCEEKHMGSRAVLVLTRDDDVARIGFGVPDGIGALYTRTGRPFFDPTTTADLLRRARVAAGGVFADLDCRYLILDAELLPWNIKGETLIRESFATVPAAAGPELALLAAELGVATDRGLDVGQLVEATNHRRVDVAAFDAALLSHVVPGAGIDDVRIAPFEVLAAGGDNGDQSFESRSHCWHLEIADRLVDAEPGLFSTTRRLAVDTTSAGSRADGAAWWTDLTRAGGEGMVVKPADNLVRDSKNRLIAPGMKVRGPEYLRIIYGPSYLDDLPRLRSRDLRHKRSMAMREYQLAREALARHRERAPLWRVHECVFGVLALESEPVDSRL
ncbi:polynucleotide kinase-phosphatase [Gordonia sp. CPCC 205515]|uniref:polynucleotide kinase-phosphatase n=1 Tax=Gordonia sp. CPCC 205515 TaxID=3140791 RepID=UPI003AF3D667